MREGSRVLSVPMLPQKESHWTFAVDFPHLWLRFQQQHNNPTLVPDQTIINHSSISKRGRGPHRVTRDRQPLSHHMPQAAGLPASCPASERAENNKSKINTWT